MRKHLTSFDLKLIAIMVMHIVGEKINSQVLITSVEESKTDLISSVAVAIITILQGLDLFNNFLPLTTLIICLISFLLRATVIAEKI